jgi:hypothetical protein
LVPNFTNRMLGSLKILNIIELSVHVIAPVFRFREVRFPSGPTCILTGNQPGITPLANAVAVDDAFPARVAVRLLAP